MSTRLLLLAFGFFATGCLGPAHFRFTPSGLGALEPRPADCEFAVTATVPSEGFEELGLVEYASGDGVNSADAFRRSIAPQVCEAGGELVVSEVNGYGYYVRGAVMRRVRGAPSDAGGDGESAPEQETAPAAP